MKPTDDVREALADLQHQQWSGWMEYLFNKCQLRTDEGRELPIPRDDDLVIPGAYVHNLKRLMATPYQDLTENEQESDRIEADKYLPFITAAEQRGREEGEIALARKVLAVSSGVRKQKGFTQSKRLQLLTSEMNKIIPSSLGFELEDYQTGKEDE